MRVAAFVANGSYPLYFLDFETAQPAIPLFDGTRPYQQIPTQYSLHVLPALFPNDPELDYRNLQGVHNGSEAMAAFARMASMGPEELAQTREQLLRYCELDTYAMVKIWLKLVEAAGDAGTCAALCYHAARRA